MDRAAFLKISSLLGFGVAVNPTSLLAKPISPWVIELLKELAKGIAVELITKPIEDYFSEHHQSATADQVKAMNEQYAQQNIYRKDHSYLAENAVFYPIATPENINRKGQYIVPFYRNKDGNNFNHLGNLGKHEIETMAWAANHLAAEKGISRQRNSRIILPDEPIQRVPFDGGVATIIKNNEQGEIILYKYTQTLYASCSIQSVSFSPKKPTILPRFELIT